MRVHIYYTGTDNRENTTTDYKTFRTFLKQGLLTHKTFPTHHS